MPGLAADVSAGAGEGGFKRRSLGLGCSRESRVVGLDGRVAGGGQGFDLSTDAAVTFTVGVVGGASGSRSRDESCADGRIGRCRGTAGLGGRLRRVDGAGEGSDLAVDG